MKRVASLYLPEWPIDRLRQAEPSAPPEASARAALDAVGKIAAVERAAQCSVPKEGGWRPGARWARSEDAHVDREARIASLPAHQRPSQRQLGRCDVAADHPFKGEGAVRGHSNADPATPAWTGALPRGNGPIPRELARRTEPAAHPFRAMPPDEGGAGGAGVSLASWAAMPPVQFPGEGPHGDAHGRAPPDGYPGTGRFFQTGRTLGSVVARVCPERGHVASSPTAMPDAPLVTAHKVGNRVLVAAASAGARALGLEPGTALTQARAQVPGLDVRDADPAGDAAALHALAVALARRWTPIVAMDGADGLLLDLTGVAHLHGGEARFARRLVRLLAARGMTARIGIADTAGAAWAAARFGAYATGAERPVLLVEPGATPALLSPLPVQALRLDAPALELLARLGVDRVEQLLALPRGPLVRRFGAGVAARIDRATGALPEPLRPVVPPEAIGVAQRFAEPIATAEAIDHWLGVLMPRLSTALAGAGLGARAVELVADRVDGVPQRLRVGLARPTRDPDHLLRLVRRRIEEVEPGYGIDALSLHVRRADPLAATPLAPALAEEAAPDLAPLVDAIANRIGEGRLWRTRALESDIPERSVAPLPALEAPERAPSMLKHDDVRRLDRTAPDHPWHPRWPRPARLLRRPERLDHVIAELPDQPPRRFTWRGQAHLVVQADGPERIEGEWWRRTAERGAVRDYFQVEDEEGRRFWLFRRGDGVRAGTGDLSWYMHGAFG